MPPIARPSRSNKTASPVKAVPVSSSSSSSASSASDDDMEEEKFNNNNSARPDIDAILDRDTGKWHDVLEDEIPRMSYEGYVEMAHAMLNEETMAACKKTTKPKDGANWLDTRAPLEFIRVPVNEPHPSHALLQLQRKVNLVTGRIQHRVVAKVDLKGFQILTFVGGQLMYTADANREAFSPQTHLVLDRSQMQARFNYKGKQSVVISQARCKNIAAFIRDPSDQDDDETNRDMRRATAMKNSAGSTTAVNAAASPARRSSAVSDVIDLSQSSDVDADAIADDKKEELSESGNAYMDLEFDKESGVVFAIIYAIGGGIKMGTEILMHFRQHPEWPDHASNRIEQELSLRARINHYQHRYITSIEKKLREELDNLASKKSSQPRYDWLADPVSKHTVVPPSAQQVAEHWGEFAERERWHKQNWSLAGSFGSIEWNELFKLANCMPMQCSYYAGSIDDVDPDVLSAEQRHYLKSLPNYFPATVAVQAVHKLDKDARKYKVDKVFYAQRESKLQSELAAATDPSKREIIQRDLEFAQQFHHVCKREPKARRNNNVTSNDDDSSSDNDDKDVATECCSWRRRLHIPLEHAPLNRTSVYRLLGRQADGRTKLPDKQIDKMYGHDESIIDVKEILNLNNPVRYYSVPQRRCFGIVAKKRIPRGTPLYFYAGQLEAANKTTVKSSSYVYGVSKAEMQKILPQYDGPDLQIDAEQTGNVARFANDVRFREREIKDQGGAFNAKWTLCFFDGLPMLLFYAWRDIGFGEEVVIEYGNAYWQDTLRNMLTDHSDYYNWSSRYMSYLHDVCCMHDVAVPRPPSKIVESYGLFEHKLKPYPGKMLPPSSKIEWEIDYIVEKYRDNRGYLKYEVKWKGYHNSTFPYADTFITDDNRDIAERFYKLHPKMRDLKGNKTRTKDDHSDSDSDSDDDSKDNDKKVVYIDEATAAHKVKLLDKEVQHTTTVPKKPKAKPGHKRKLSKAAAKATAQALTKQVKAEPVAVPPPAAANTIQATHPFFAVPAAAPAPATASFHSAPTAISAPLQHYPAATPQRPQPPQWSAMAARSYSPPTNRPISIIEIDVEQAAPTQSKTLTISY